ncbi:MAG: tRNA pseudouridine(55) synthase TruB [Clostridia bacterium]|nr:tRNA pseudouridine(55) synthase TruB [Clostridia bacterium]
MSSEITGGPMGILVIDKHAGVTSHDIVSRCRKLYCTRKIGHTGTLDPMATGVLVILVGRAAKASEYLMEHDKKYICEMKLGITTDTEDITGRVLSASDDIPDEAEVLRTAGEFSGHITQVPPMYSALKVGGRKLVDLARRGEEVSREPRSVCIKSLKAERISRDSYRLYVECTKGTYVRTLCADIGKKLGCGAAMSSLRRTASGVYTIDSSLAVDELEGLSYEERVERLLPVESAFAGMPAVRLDKRQAALVKNGSMIDQKMLGLDLKEGELVTLSEGNDFFAIGRAVRGTDSICIRHDKLFVL